MTKTIRVECWDIKNAKKGLNSSSQDVCAICPIALAIQRAFKDSSVRMYITSLSVNDKRVKVPALVSEWIYRFDALKPVEPFTFELEY